MKMEKRKKKSATTTAVNADMIKTHQRRPQFATQQQC